MNNIYPPATQRPGPIDKQGYGSVVVNACRGVVCHSMVGYRAGALIELDKASRRASWHFSVLQSGEVLQHYPVNAVTWHCGSAQWNEKLIGIEHEGGFDPADEPLTDAQREASVALVRWLSQECGFPLERKVALWEHNEVAPPSDATSCPSNRIPWDAYTEARMYDDQTIDVKFLKAIAFLQGQMKDDRNALADAIGKLAQANATSFKGIEDRLTALGAK